MNSSKVMAKITVLYRKTKVKVKITDHYAMLSMLKALVKHAYQI